MALAGSQAACTHIPRGRRAVTAVDVKGANTVDPDAIAGKLATERTKKFLGLFRGILYDYELYDKNSVSKDLARIERYYRARGYYESRARSARVIEQGDDLARVEFIVEENAPSLITSVELKGAEKLPPTVIVALRRAAEKRLPKGVPFDEDAFEAAEVDLRRVLRDASYAVGEVRRDAAVDVARKEAKITFEIEPGPACKFGKITVEGLGDLPEDRVRLVMDLEEGEDYSIDAIESATQNAMELGVFGSVDVNPDLSQAKEGGTVVPLRVKVEPSRLRTLTLGGGIEFNPLKLAANALVGWQHRNFFGGLRQFRIEERPGMVFYPTRLASDIQPPRTILPQNSLRGELRQPGFFEARTTGFVRGENTVAPVILNPNPPPEDPVIGYIDTRATIGVDRPFGRVFAVLSHTVQVDDPFSYIGELNKPDAPAGLRYETIVLSYPTLLATLDLRDSKLKPTKGTLSSLDVQAAGLGGDAIDFRVLPDVRGYVTPFKGVTLAARASVGFLFPSNYRPEEVVDANGTIKSYRDSQIMLFRGFFSGGPSSNRGYPFRGVGPRGYTNLQNPDIAGQIDQSTCSGFNPAEAAPGDDRLVRCSVPLGGTSLWEASIEARVDVVGPFSVSAFCDASNVTTARLTLDFSKPHVSCGPGFRVDTPVGPIRLDFGFRIPGLQDVNNKNGKSIEELAAGELIEGVPLSLNFGLGEAF